MSEPVARDRFRAPSAPLRPYISMLWWSETVPEHAVERRLPSAEPQLIFNLAGDTLRWFSGPDLQRLQVAPAAVVSGPGDKPFGIASDGRERLLGVVFRPGAASVVLGHPLHLLANDHTPLDALDLTEGLRDRLLGLDPESAFQCVEQWLLDRIESRPDPLVAAAVCDLSKGAMVRDVEADLGLSGSALRRRFRAAVGLNPKRFARLARFRRAVRAIAARPPENWAAFAAEHGYFDQAHLIRAFRDFSGLTPRVARQAESTGHLIER